MKSNTSVTWSHGAMQLISPSYLISQSCCSAGGNPKCVASKILACSSVTCCKSEVSSKTVMFATFPDFWILTSHVQHEASVGYWILKQRPSWSFWSFHKILHPKWVIIELSHQALSCSAGTANIAHFMTNPSKSNCLTTSLTHHITSLELGDQICQKHYHRLRPSLWNVFLFPRWKVVAFAVLSDGVQRNARGLVQKRCYVGVVANRATCIFGGHCQSIHHLCLRLSCCHCHWCAAMVWKCSGPIWTYVLPTYLWLERIGSVLLSLAVATWALVDSSSAASSQ